MLKYFRKKKDTPTDFEISESKGGQYRTLHVYNDGWKGRSIRILDSDNSTLLYEIDLRNRKPNMTIRRPGSGVAENVGTVKFNTWSRAINADITNNNSGTISVKSKNWKCVELPYTSPAFGGRTLTWNRKTPYMVREHLLMDENNMPLARINPRNCSVKKAETIELVDPTLGQDAIDEIVITGLAVVQNTKYYTNINTVAVVT